MGKGAKLKEKVEESTNNQDEGVNRRKRKKQSEEHTGIPPPVIGEFILTNICFRGIIYEHLIKHFFLELIQNRMTPELLRNLTNIDCRWCHFLSY